MIHSVSGQNEPNRYPAGVTGVGDEDDPDPGTHRGRLDDELDRVAEAVAVSTDEERKALKEAEAGVVVLTVHPVLP